MRPNQWELDAALGIVKNAVENNEVLQETLQELSDNLLKERRRADELEDKLSRWQRQSIDDDDRRDRRIRDLADQIEEINRPRTEATGAAGAATVINAARKKEFWTQLAMWVAMVIVYLLTLLGVRLPRTEPNVSLPDTSPRPAGTGFAGSP